MCNIVGTRMKEEDIVLLRKVCQARGENISSFVRRSVRKELASLSFLSEMDKKALGLSAQNVRGEK